VPLCRCAVLHIRHEKEVTPCVQQDWTRRREAFRMHRSLQAAVQRDWRLALCLEAQACAPLRTIMRCARSAEIAQK